MSVVSFALIGCGSMGRTLADSLREHRDSHLVAAADPNEDARLQAVAKYGVQGYTRYEDLLQRDDIDAVVVATPSYLHKEVAVAAAKAGKHVFCEKPMALNTADCDAMLQAAKDAGVKLMVGHVLRLMFPWWRIKELAGENELGAPFCVSIRRYSRMFPRGWRAQSELSGGQLFEVHVHELDFMRHLCGEVAEVSAYGGSFACDDGGKCDVYLINLRFRSGAVGQLHGGATTGRSRYEGQVLCPRGALLFGPDWGTGTMEQGDREPQPLDPDVRTGPVGVDWELDSFLRWLLRGDLPVFTGEDGRAAVQLAEAARRSIADAWPVGLS